MKRAKAVCKFADWDDTTFPRPVCHCLKREDIDCANDPNDVEACPDFKPRAMPPFYGKHGLKERPTIQQARK